MYDWAEFRHFRYLLAILEKQGFRLAAEELNASQPNLTVQARQFQENASIRLFRRLRNGRIRPTETGIAFIALAKFLLTMRNEVVDVLQAIERGEIRSIQLGCSPWVDAGLFRELCALHKEMLPSCAIHPTHDDTSQLAEDVLTGIVDAAIVTLPLENPELHLEVIRQDRLVVCLRTDDPLAQKASIRAAELDGRLRVLYHPRRHPDAHDRLMQMLAEQGVNIYEHSRASNPFELQMLVREGHGVALVREGSVTDSELTTRPIAGVSWTVDTAIIYRKDRYPKTLPIVMKSLKRRHALNAEAFHRGEFDSCVPPKRPPKPASSSEFTYGSHRKSQANMR